MGIWPSKYMMARIAYILLDSNHMTQKLPILETRCWVMKIIREALSDDHIFIVNYYLNFSLIRFNRFQSSTSTVNTRTSIIVVA